MTLRHIALWLSPLACFSGAVAMPSSTLRAETQESAGAKVSFSREILPLLSDACFQCHGPDASHRKGDLRLDSEADAKRLRESGTAIVPGKSGESELLRRLVSHDADEQMPPPKLGRPLTAEQIERVRQWIDEGAVWGSHWAFTRVERPTVPKIEGKLHPVDAFVMERLRGEGITPSPEADRRTLIRRLTLDLTGLPPAAKQVEEFLADTAPGAWERLVDRTLASAAYGERMAWDWLDAARYADSNGYQGDRERTMWPWRDWVVRAFNENLPYDQFTIWQLAGDLLPAATEEQILATGFCRNYMINGEGGRIPEENRVDYVMDMAETMGTVWMGLTVGCARCHDHKFDPVTQKDYFSLYAFFDQTPVTGAGGDPQTAPILAVRTEEQKARELTLREGVEKAGEAYQKRWETIAAGQAAWEERRVRERARETWKPLAFASLASQAGQALAVQPDGRVTASGSNPDNDTYTLVSASGSGATFTGLRLEAVRDAGMTGGGFARSDSGNFVLTEVDVRWREKAGADWRRATIASGQASFEQGGFPVRGAFDGNSVSGWAVWDGKPITRDQHAMFRFSAPVSLPPGGELEITLRHDSVHKHHNLGCFRVSTTDVPEPKLLGNDESLLATLSVAPGQRSKEQVAELRRAYEDSDTEAAALRGKREQAEAALKGLLDSFPKVMVMADMEKPRQTFMLDRGLYNEPLDPVGMAVPASLPAMAGDAPASRLGLARWLISREHPLTARVTVNRLWQQVFGIGLVKTPEDFGVQAEFPKHPELLDWLAADFMETGWDVKRLLRTFVTSEAYRRSSVASVSLIELDPENRLLARGARYRLPSWMIRDQALAASGLLVPARGGAPVNGYQPPGIWEEATFGAKKYVQDQGDALYRRSLYTFWRRIVGPTMFFDNAARQVCTVKTVRTNTPLHALTTLNDVTFVEAARALAQRVWREADPLAGDRGRIALAYRRVLARDPLPEELDVWLGGLDRARAAFAASPEDAGAFLKTGESPRDEGIPGAEHAALATVCLGLLNLDETLSRE